MHPQEGSSRLIFFTNKSCFLVKKKISSFLTKKKKVSSELGMDIEGLFMTMENSDYTIRMDQSTKLGNSSYDALMTSDHGMICFFSA